MLRKGSLANAKLINDAKIGVLSAVSGKGCSKLEKFDPYVVSMPKGEPGSRTWEERWVVIGCGSEYPVDLKFSEDGKGGAYWTVK